MASHQVRFEQSQFDRSARAICSCGWSHAGTLAECQLRASTHDLDEPDTKAQIAAQQPVEF